jgi:hypothetical protein
MAPTLNLARPAQTTPAALLPLGPSPARSTQAAAELPSHPAPEFMLRRASQAVTRHLACHAWLQPEREDLIQEYCLAQLKVLPRVDPSLGRPMAYLHACGLGALKEQTRRVGTRGCRETSLDLPHSDGSRETLADRLPDPGAPDSAEVASGRELRSFLGAALSRLSAPDRDLLLARSGAVGPEAEPEPWASLALRFERSETRVRRHYQGLCRQLQAALGGLA